jgi:amidase
MVETGAPANIESFYKFTDDVSNPELFESWKPKIQAYREALEKNTLPEYRVSESEIPSDLDSKIFNTNAYLSSSTALSTIEKKITESTATELVDNIAKGVYSSVDVLKAFAHRAVIVQQFTNFAMDFFINEGIARAQELDDYLAKNGKTIGPLHGLPISLKEQIGYGGKITNGGWVGWLTNIPKEDATTIKTLKKLGATFYVRTNQPQSLMHLDSNNNIIGRTRNPFNSLLTPGGSSGGEGACVAARASVIGVGTDIGGSIRAPAAFSGCYGLRPTTRRISCYGGVSSGRGQESVVAVAGPLTNSVEDIDLFMKSYINEGKPWDDDPWCIPVFWRDVPKPNPKNITVAIMYDDGQVKPHPPIQRGLKFVESKLKEAGVNVVTFEPIETKEAYDVVNEMYSCDGNFAQKEMIRPSGEPLLPLTKWALSFGQGDKMYTASENRELNYKRDALRKKYTDFFVKEKVDFILSPTYVGVAPVCIDDGIAGPYYWGYTTLFNILDLPTLVFPTGLSQDPNVDVKDETYVPRSSIDKIEQDKYIPELFKGAPICFQLTARRYFDEEVVAFGKVIEDILKA